MERHKPTGDTICLHIVDGASDGNGLRLMAAAGGTTTEFAW